MELIFEKWLAAAALLTLTVFFATLPLIIWKNRVHENNGRSSRFLSLLSCVGAGVFMGTCLLHLFPEVEVQMNTVFQMLHTKQTFPAAEFLLAFGFLTILVIEQIVLVFQQSGGEQLPFLSHQHSHSQGEAVDVNVRHITSSYGTVTPNVERMDSNLSVHEDYSSHSPIRSAVLVLALSLHSLFEGLAIGLQSSTQNVISILVAVFIHKSVIAFTLGLNLMNSPFEKRMLVWSVGIFSAMSPLGTVAGSIITDFSQGLGLVLTSTILQGISAGTFLYVTFFEILPHELNSMVDKLWKVVCLILGFSGISLLILYLPN